MAGFRIDFSQDQQSNANGDAYSGGKLYCYTNETTTLVSLYSDAAATVTAANPIVADSAGRLPVRYVGASSPLTLTFKTSADVLVWSNDDFEPVPNIANADLANYLPLAGGTMTGALRFKEGAAVASATSINADASGGNINHITGTTTISTITLNEGAARVFIFDAALQLTHSSNLLLIGAANITTAAGDMALFIGEGSGVTRMCWYTLASGKPLIEPAEWLVSVGDETTAITTGTAKRTFRAPHGFTLDAIPSGSLTTASSSGVVQVDINKNGTTIFTTELTIDASETTSATAAAACVLDGTITFAENDQVTIDIVAAGTNAAGLKTLLRGYRRNRT